MKLNLSLTIYILIFLLTLSCGQKKQKEGPPAPKAVAVNTFHVTSQEVSGADQYPGTVVAVNEVELRPQVAGYITAIFVKDGQAVKQGQTIYEIDRTKYQAAYSQAQANLLSSQANLEKVKKDVERYERLLEREAIARQQVDYARAALKTAQSQVMSAEAQLRSAATDLGYSLIKAPFDGNIGISQVRIGSQVSPGQTLLNTISSNDPIAIDFVVNQNEIPGFNRMLTSGNNTDSTFHIILSDGTTYPQPAKLTTIDRAVDRQTGSITIRVNTPNPDRQLIPGMIVDIRVKNQDIGKKLVIPNKAVLEQMGEYFVYVVQGDSVVQRKIEPGSAVQDKIVVREGLAEGETIVAEGIQNLRQGAKITTGNTPQPNVNQSKK